MSGPIGSLSGVSELDVARETVESKDMPRKNMTKERAAGLLADLALEHLAGYPPAERDARIRAFRRKAATLKKTAKSSKHSRASVGRRQARAV